MFEVDLTFTEFHAGVSVGLQRLIASTALRLDHHSSGVRRTWLERLGDDVRGALAELAWAKHRGEFYCGSCNTFHDEPDVHGVEIRSMRRPNDSLLIRSNDDPSRPYVLTHANGQKVSFVGWAWGKDAMRDEWLRAPRGGKPAWFMPQSSLRSFDEFPKKNNPRG